MKRRTEERMCPLCRTIGVFVRFGAAHEFEGAVIQTFAVSPPFGWILVGNHFVCSQRCLAKEVGIDDGEQFEAETAE